MSRKHKHEDHQNHEAWAIPYGDLVTLLLAFFVVMYAVSSLNEGKYRVLSDSLSAAFRGAPRSVEPVQVGDKPVRGRGSDPRAGVLPSRIEKPSGAIPEPRPNVKDEEESGAEGELELRRIADQVEAALADLIARDLVTVRRERQWVEIEIRTDILFASGESHVAAKAEPVLRQLAAIMKGLPNPLRVEGHTDNVPIRTAIFPSNWELSAARAASVVHLFMTLGVDPQRMEISGFGEYRPSADNRLASGRDRNRRVVVIVLDPSLRGPGVMSELAPMDGLPRIVDPPSSTSAPDPVAGTTP
jgi:chemotaxis protein MotB